MYFSKFPTVSYPTRIKDNKAYVVGRNIIRRVALSEETKNSSGAFIEYNIKDGERPEHIADRVYGNPNDHWVVLLSNDIIDPYHDWYKSSAVFEEYVLKKYSGYALFFALGSQGIDYKKIKYFNVGDTISRTDISGVSQKLTSVNRDFYYGVVKEKTDLDFITSASAFFYKISSLPDNIRIARVLPYKDAVHHFEVGASGSYGSKVSPSEKNIVNPLIKFSSTLSYTDPGIGGVAPLVGIQQDGIVSTTGLAFRDTFIGKYLDIQYTASTKYEDQYAVSNYKYEYDLNESRRQIKVLHPRYLDTVKREFESLLRV